MLIGPKEAEETGPWCQDVNGTWMLWSVLALSTGKCWAKDLEKGQRKERIPIPPWERLKEGHAKCRDRRFRPWKAALPDLSFLVTVCGNKACHWDGFPVILTTISFINFTERLLSEEV